MASQRIVQCHPVLQTHPTNNSRVATNGGAPAHQTTSGNRTPPLRSYNYTTKDATDNKQRKLQGNDDLVTSKRRNCSTGTPLTSKKATTMKRKKLGTKDRKIKTNMGMDRFNNFDSGRTNVTKTKIIA